MRTVLLGILVVCSLQVSAQSYGPDPIVSIANMTWATNDTGTSTIDQVLASPKLVIANTTGYMVKTFTLGIRRFNGDWIGPFYTKSPELSQEMIDALNAVKGRAGTIFIDDIKVFGPDRRTRPVAGINIKYTN